jgi:hypothetical protein
MNRTLLAACLLACQSAGPPPSREPTTRAGALTLTLPARADGALRVSRAPGVYIDVRTLGARSVRREGLHYVEAFADTELVYELGVDRVEEVRHVARRGVDRTLRYQIGLGPSLARLRVVDDYVEALDHDGVARLRTEPAWVIDAKGAKTSLTPRVIGDVLEYPIDDRALAYPITIDPAWTTTGSMATPRRDHEMHLLPSGKVVAISGATTGLVRVKSVEVYDPATASWTSGGSILNGRFYFGSALLSTGKIFIVGDLDESSIAHSAELFDPIAGTSTALPATTMSAALPSVTEVGIGKVLVVGNDGAQLFDIAANKWIDTPGATPRYGHHAALFAPGKVLAAGGARKSADVFDYATMTWKAAAPMSAERDNPEVQPLPGGKVLVAGGGGLSSAEVYDPASDTWTSTPSMTHEHSYGSAVVLADKRVMMIGGVREVGFSDLAEIYDASLNRWIHAGVLAAPREEHRSAVLPTGKVLVAGGDSGVNPLPTVEIFEPLAIGKACLGAGECSAGFCVDGICCEKSACPVDETCVTGKCLKKVGEKCAAATACATGQCVDSVCCESACTDQCGACDVAGSLGKCVPIAAGSMPHGARAPCAGSDVCAGKCGGLDRSKCTQFPGNAIECGKPACADGVETERRGCDGAGNCSLAVTRKCDAYTCGPTACKTQCDTNTDCANGSECNLVIRKCVAASTCADDRTLKSPDGLSRDCAPFRCTGSRCVESCDSSDACAAGYVCDVPSKRCVVPPLSESDGGCAMSRGSDGWLLVALAAIALGRRRRLPS